MRRMQGSRANVVRDCVGVEQHEVLARLHPRDPAVAVRREALLTRPPSTSSSRLATSLATCSRSCVVGEHDSRLRGRAVVSWIERTADDEDPGLRRRHHDCKPAGRRSIPVSGPSSDRLAATGRSREFGVKGHAQRLGPNAPAVAQVSQARLKTFTRAPDNALDSRRDMPPRSRSERMGRHEAGNIFKQSRYGGGAVEALTARGRGPAGGRDAFVRGSRIAHAGAVREIHVQGGSRRRPAVTSVSTPDA